MKRAREGGFECWMRCRRGDKGNEWCRPMQLILKLRQFLRMKQRLSGSTRDKDNKQERRNEIIVGTSRHLILEVKG